MNLICVPYDAGHYNQRMGRGPKHLMEAGIIQRLSSAGYKVSNKEVRSSAAFLTEIATSFELLNEVSIEVAHSIDNKTFPLILSANCSSTLGAVAGLGTSNIGIVWLDAHGDCETPETTTSGFLDGMGLSMLAGHCWRYMLTAIKGHSPIPGENIVLIGARDLSEFEEEFIRKAGIRHITAQEAKQHSTEVITQSLAKLKEQGVQKLHLHIDVDVLDPSIAVANSYAVAGGLSKENVFDIIQQFGSELPLTSATVASYDPSFDVEGRMCATIFDLLEKVVRTTS